MKDIDIYRPTQLTDTLGVHFQPAGTTLAIKCAYDLTNKCTPNCAACEIAEGKIWSEATCLRGSFDIGKFTNPDN